MDQVEGRLNVVKSSRKKNNHNKIKGNQVPRKSGPNIGKQTCEDSDDLEDNQTKIPHFLPGNAERKRPTMTMGIPPFLPQDQNFESETSKIRPSNYVKKIVENIEEKEKRTLMD